MEPAGDSNATKIASKGSNADGSDVDSGFEADEIDSDWLIEQIIARKTDKVRNFVPVR
jgi:hypothetical protein